MITNPAELRDVVLDMASNLDPDALSGETAAAMVTELARVEKVVASARMFMAIRVAKTGAWKGRGHASAADWLAAQCGMSVRQAAAQLGTATKAKGLPKTKEAMDRGRLSPDQAGAVTDAAAADPACEEDLLSSAANDTAKELRDKANRARAAATDTAARERRIRAERTLRMRTDADGAFTMWLRGPAHQGARLAAMMKPFLEDAFRQARSNPNTTGLRDTFDNRSHDAFYDLLEYLHTLAALATGTPPDTAKPADTAGKASSGNARTPGTSGQSSPDAEDAQGRSNSTRGSSKANGSNPGATTDTTGSSNGSSRLEGLGRSNSPAGLSPEDETPPAPEPPEPSEPGSSKSGSPGSGSPGSGSSGSGQPATAAPGSIRPEHLDYALRDQDRARVEALSRRLPGGNNTKVIINIDLAALRRGHTKPGETCEITGLGPVAVDVARQLMDDAFIAAVIRDSTHIHTVTHLGRGLNAHQRTALEAVGIRCSNIACNQTVAIEIDHRTPWADQPVTELANQDPLCPRCHNLKTHQHHRLEPGNGPRRLLSPQPAATSSPRQTTLI